MPMTPRPATAGPMSRPSLPSTIRAAIARMKTWRTRRPRSSSVSIRFWSSTALSSLAVPSATSRSSSALTMPCTNRPARRMARTATMTMSSTGTRLCRTKSEISAALNWGIAPRVPSPRAGGPHLGGRGDRCDGSDRGDRLAGRDRGTESDRDRRRGFARLCRELGHPTWGEAERRAPDVDRGDDVAAGVMDRGTHGVQTELVLADRRRVAAPADPCQLLEEWLELDDRPLRIPREPTADD